MKVDGKYQLLVVRARYLKTTLKLSKDIFQHAHTTFMEALSNNPNILPVKKSSRPRPNPEIQESAPFEAPEDEGETVEAIKEEKDENLKQVFKKIAAKVHPDKTLNDPWEEKSYKALLFEKARMYLEANDYCGIVEIAEELGIKPPAPTKKQIQMMKKTNRILEDEIDTIEESLVWGWYHAEGEEKETLMEKYIEHLRKNNTRP